MDRTRHRILFCQRCAREFIIVGTAKGGTYPTDVHHIEYLDDKEVLRHLPGGFRWLKRNIRQDVIDYFEAFAQLLEDKLLREIRIPEDLFHGQHPQDTTVPLLEQNTFL